MARSHADLCSPNLAGNGIAIATMMGTPASAALLDIIVERSQAELKHAPCSEYAIVIKALVDMNNKLSRSMNSASNVITCWAAELKAQKDLVEALKKVEIASEGMIDTLKEQHEIMESYNALLLGKERILEAKLAAAMNKPAAKPRKSILAHQHKRLARRVVVRSHSSPR